MRRKCIAIRTTLLLVGLAVVFPNRSYSQLCSKSSEASQTFPLEASQSYPYNIGTPSTEWRVCWQVQAKYGLVITSAEFRILQDGVATPSRWVQVLGDARVSEIFVPYHEGSTRFYDMTGFTFILFPLTAADCPSSTGGTLLGQNLVCRQVRDRGLLWKFGSHLQRGSELVMWSVLRASYYYYVIEWTFRDDGVIAGRVGATGKALTTMAHTHNVVWRLDVDLDGSGGDSAYRGTHTEGLPGPTATDTEIPIEREAGIEWDPLHFHTIDVHDGNLQNSRGHPVSYQLVPSRSGSARHQEQFTNYDFWVTRPYSSFKSHYNPDLSARDLPDYVNPPDSVSETDLVLWYRDAIHHRTRDEDGHWMLWFNDGENDIFQWTGETPVNWVGFTLVPHNLFSCTPLGCYLIPI